MNNSIIELLTRQEGDTCYYNTCHPLSQGTTTKLRRASCRIVECGTVHCRTETAYLPFGPVPAFSMTPLCHLSTLNRPCFGYLQRMCLPFANLLTKLHYSYHLPFKLFFNSTERKPFPSPLIILYNYTVAEDFENATKLGVAPDTNYRFHYNSYRLFVNTNLSLFFLGLAMHELTPHFRFAQTLKPLRELCRLK